MSRNTLCCTWVAGTLSQRITVYEPSNATGWWYKRTTVPTVNTTVAEVSACLRLFMYSIAPLAPPKPTISQATALGWTTSSDSATVPGCEKYQSEVVS